MAASKYAIQETLTLSTNIPVKIPRLGLGTYLSPPDRTRASCLAALEVGYRHIDTAQYYGNEAEVGQAIRQCGLAREDIFVTTKILKTGKSVDANYAACLESIERIGGGKEDGYVDLFLIHSTRGGPKKRADMWLALERLYEEGRVKAIGVSNFGIQHIEQLKGVGKVWPPHVDQFEVSTSSLFFFFYLIPSSTYHLSYCGWRIIPIYPRYLGILSTMLKFKTASPLVSTERNRPVLRGPQHRRPGILSHREEQKSR